MKTVFVGLSGGVDSAVAAAMLHEEFRVVGVFMKNWSGVTAGVKCPWEDDYASAKTVAAYLGIELRLYDFEDLYRATVGKYLVETYAAGLTPNPDIMCNEEIKFKAFYQKCRYEGADYIATGHYARSIDGKLCRGRDEGKDQSYFLYRIDPAVLPHTLFPLGNLHKSEVRERARALQLPNAERADSVGICFVGPVSMKDYLHEFIEYKTGDVIDEDGRKIGTHDGVFFYTIGQRHGLGIGGGKPYFVYDKDVTKNILYVTTNPESERLNTNEFVITNCHWFDEPQEDTNYDVQVRYRSRAVNGKLIKASNDYTVVLANPERAITPGQAAVIYDGDVVLGGGVIK